MLAAAVISASCSEKNGPDEPKAKAGFKVTLPSDGPLGVCRWNEAAEIRVGEGVFKIKEGAGKVKEKISEALEKTEIDDKIKAGVENIKDKFKK